MINLKVKKEELVKVVSSLEPKTLDECLALDPKFGKYGDRSGFVWDKFALSQLTEEGLIRLFYSLL